MEAVRQSRFTLRHQAIMKVCIFSSDDSLDKSCSECYSLRHHGKCTLTKTPDVPPSTQTVCPSYSNRKLDERRYHLTVSRPSATTGVRSTLPCRTPQTTGPNERKNQTSRDADR